MCGDAVQSLRRWSPLPGSNGGDAMANKFMDTGLKIGESETLGAASPPEFFSAPAGFNDILRVNSGAEI